MAECNQVKNNNNKKDLILSWDQISEVQEENRTPEKAREKEQQSIPLKAFNTMYFTISTVFVATRCFCKLERQMN